MHVAATLIAEIEAGTYGAGDPIPSDPELVRRFGVARETARRAVGVLRDRGLVETVWGRGSFVLPTTGVTPDGPAEDADGAAP